VYVTKMARELRPPVQADKGTAVEVLVDGSIGACFAGDDRGDLDAFAALARLSATGRLEHAVRIAVGSAEAPAELLAQADLAVEGPTGLVSLLEDLAAAATRTPR
jgi:trehalose 6-phosphate phosphatase